MITQNKIKKSQAQHIIELIEQAERANVMARLGPCSFPAYADYARISLDKRDELLEYIFGTSDMVVLAYKWRILKKADEEVRVRVKIKKKKKKKKRKKISFSDS